MLLRQVTCFLNQTRSQIEGLSFRVNISICSEAQISFIGEDPIPTLTVTVPLAPNVPAAVAAPGVSQLQKRIEIAVF